MAWKEMKRNIFSVGLARVFEFDETLASPGNSDWILTPKNKGTIKVALSPTAGSGRVEYTFSNVATVKTGSPIVAIWDAGVITEYDDDVLYKVTAIRLVNVSGTTQMVGGASK